MKQERVKALKSQVEAHYKGRKRDELIGDIANMSAVLEEQHALLNQLYETKESALAVAQSVINLLFKDKEQVELPADLVETIKAMKLSNMSAEGFIRAGAYQYGAAGSRKEQARNAINARHDKEGGYRDCKKKMLEFWAAGIYKTHRQCAKKHHKDLGIGEDAAREYLRNAPEPENWIAKGKK